MDATKRSRRILTMEWCVCKHKVTGELFVMPRNARDIMLNVLLDFENGVNSLVLKTFDDRDDATKYVAEQNATDSLINKIIE